jgi:Flp pilus assembly protein TadG
MFKSHPPDFADSERGSSLVEFTILMPLFLSVFSIGFSQVFETQLREQALTAFTRSLARAVELGATRDEAVEFAGVLQADSRFEHPPSVTFACVDDSQVCNVSAFYRKVSHTCLIDGAAVHESLSAEFESVDLGPIR